MITSFQNLFCEPSVLEVPVIVTSCFPDVVVLRAYTVRLEALRALGSGILKRRSPENPVPCKPQYETRFFG